MPDNGIGGEISVTTLVFHFRLFPGKTNETIFQKKKPKNYFGAVLGPFFQNLDKNFPAKKATASF